MSPQMRTILRLTACLQSLAKPQSRQTTKTWSILAQKEWLSSHFRTIPQRKPSMWPWTTQEVWAHRLSATRYQTTTHSPSRTCLRRARAKGTKRASRLQMILEATATRTSSMMRTLVPATSHPTCQLRREQKTTALLLRFGTCRQRVRKAMKLLSKVSSKGITWSQIWLSPLQRHMLRVTSLRARTMSQRQSMTLQWPLAQLLTCQLWVGLRCWRLKCQGRLPSSRSRDKVMTSCLSQALAHRRVKLARVISWLRQTKSRLRTILDKRAKTTCLAS